jgi:hypothetical protein
LVLRSTNDVRRDILAHQALASELGSPISIEREFSFYKPGTQSVMNATQVLSLL